MSRAAAETARELLAVAAGEEEGLHFTPGTEQVVYTRKGGQDTAEPADEERIDAEGFVARVLVPDPRRHLVRYSLTAYVRWLARRRSAGAASGS